MALALQSRDTNFKDVEVKVGIDGGQGFLKVTVSMTKGPVNDEPSSKRSKYQDGYGAKEFKDTSVYKCLILACLPTMDESYPCLKNLMDVLEVESLDYSMSQDIKVMLQVIGKQCAASTHPCPYCEAKIPLLLKSKLNTISSLLAHHNKWIAEGSKLWDLKKHNNVIHPPI